MNMRDFRLFAVAMPTGKTLRVGVWNGRRDYSSFPPPELGDLVGGPKVTIVQVSRPTNGREGRSSVALTYHLAQDFDGIIHWARDAATFHSIVEELSKETEAL